MKNIFKSVSLVLFSAFVLTGCEEDKVVFDNVGGQTMLSFAATTQNIGVGPEEGQDVSYVTVNSTTISDQARTFTVQVGEESTAEAGVEYTIDQSTFVIPAGEYAGQIKITGNFDELVEGENKTIILNIIPNGYTVDKAENVITIYRSCPVPNTFLVGNYLIEQVSAIGGDGPVLEDGAIRPVTVDPTNPTTGRVFSSYNFPNFCSTTRNNFKFELKCGFVVAGNNTGNCVCTQGTPYEFGPAISSEAYDAEDDSVIYLAFTNDVSSNCAAPDQVVYRLTRQN